MPAVMPSVRKIHAPSTHGRIARAKSGVDLPREQRADREAERDRQPDIAEVERRRMEREAEVLQQRVEPVALRAARVGSRSNGFEENSRKA